MPKNFVSLCFSVQIELADGESRVRTGGQAPAGLGGRLQTRAIWQFPPQMSANDGKQGQDS
jgi:hypothetical protein